MSRHAQPARPLSWRPVLVVLGIVLTVALALALALDGFGCALSLVCAVHP